MGQMVNALLVAILLLPLLAQVGGAPVPAATVQLVQLSADGLHNGSLHYNLSADADNRTGLLNLTNALLLPQGIAIANVSLNATVIGPGAAAAEAFQEGVAVALSVDLPTNASAGLWLRSSTDNATWGEWINAANVSDWRTPSNYVQWRVLLRSGAGNASPLLREVVIHFAVDHPPVADAGADQQGFRGQTLVLDGTNSSDADGDPLSYIWQQLEGPTAVLSSATASAPTFTPNMLGVYRFRMVINDGAGHSDLDETFVVVDNHLPMADAGANQTATKGATVALNGSATDADDPQFSLHFQWNQVGGPIAVLSNASAAIAQARLDRVGIYVFALRVNDTHDWSVPTTTSVTVGTVAPVAVLSVDDDHPLVNSSVLIDGSHSVDADGTVSRFWFTFGDGGFLNDTPNPSTSHRFTVAGTYLLQLSVADEDGAISAPMTLSLDVNDPPPPPPPNLPPVCVIETARLDTPGAITYTLLANATDPDGTITSYRWDLGDGTVVEGRTHRQLSHVYATKEDRLVRLNVTDDDGATTNLSLRLDIENLGPTIDSRSPSATSIEVDEGADLSLSIGASDPDDMAADLTYQWKVDGIAQSAQGPSLNLTAVPRSLATVSVTVLDSQQANATTSWQITVTPRQDPPTSEVSRGLTTAQLAILTVVLVGVVAALMVARQRQAVPRGARRRDNQRTVAPPNEEE